MTGPVIGISAYAERASWGSWDAPAIVLPESYVNKLTAAGGLALLLPPIPGNATGLAARLDGLILSGGSDVDPSRYHRPRHPLTQPARPQRDAFELEMLAAALEAGLPVLAICRGAQILNVARGGTLHQHLPEVLGNETHSGDQGIYASHSVDVDPASHLAKWLKALSIEVPSYHHQAIDTLGEGLEAVGLAADGTIEAVEDPSLDFLVGVQWHPEASEDPSLFQGLVEAAGSSKKRWSGPRG